jgi:hypothetical protein
LDISTAILHIISSATTLSAKGVLSAIAKGTGTTIYNRILALLENKYNIKTSELLDSDKRMSVQMQISASGVTDDSDLIALAQKLHSILIDSEYSSKEAFAVEFEELRAVGNVIIEEIEGGISGGKLISGGDVTIRDVKKKSL